MATPLQQNVWQLLTQIPRGRVSTYKALAEALNTRAIRAVASAVAQNPNAPRVPCHRVVRSDGSVGEYSGRGGTKGKQALLKQEGVQLEKNHVVDFDSICYTKFK